MNTTAKQINPSSAAAEDLVLQELGNGVATLTLNRPRQFNALSEAMLTSLQEKLERITENNAVRLVILQGAGKVFCAGHDLKEMIATRKETYYKTLFKQCSRMMMTLNQMPQPCHCQGTWNCYCGRLSIGGGLRFGGGGRGHSFCHVRNQCWFVLLYSGSSGEPKYTAQKGNGIVAYWRFH